MSFDPAKEIDPELLRQLTVLCVEDDNDAREHLVSLLGRRVAKVLAADNGEAGLAQFREHRPDVVVTDVQMPLMDGLAMAAAIKTIDRHTPVIVTTAFNDQDYLLKAIELGLDGYVIKPIDIRMVLAAMTKAARYEVQRRQQQHELEITGYLIEHMMLSRRGHDAQLRVWNLPTERFCGDMVATHRARNGDLYVMVADAIGHGLPAAVNLLPLVRIFYTMAEQGFGVAMIAGEMNDILREQSPTDRFVTATVVRVNNPNRIIEVWNGGNPPCLLVDAQGQVVCEFPAAHLPLGIIGSDGFRYDTRIVQWSGPSQMFLFSDGLLDATSATGRQFGEDGVRAVLAVAAAETDRFDALTGAWRRHMGEAKAHDDVSVVAIECR